MQSGNLGATFSLGLGLSVLLVLVSCSAEHKGHPVRAELIGSVDTVRGGEPFTVGILLTIEPEWHVYWKYSGDAGLPTEVAWKLPYGWSVSEVQWPIPRRFIENGPLTTYGYTDSVLLTALVTPSIMDGNESTLRLSAKVDWMVCHEECIPGKATVTLDLPVTITADSEDRTNPRAARFRAWQERMPVASESAGWNIQVVVAADSTNTKALHVTCYLSHPTVMAENVLDWFPAPSPNLLIKNIRRTSENGVTVVSFSLQSMLDPIGVGEVFESLLVYRDESGRARGVGIITALGVQPVS